jgi:CRP/FNR family transcriptional regulator, cyclic AMP receptor protein
MPDQPDYNRLGDVTIFRDLDKSELEIVARHVFEKSVEKDCILFTEGLPGAVLYIIMSGSVEIIKNSNDSKETILATMNAGDIVGEMSLIDSKPRSATGRTREASVLMVITKHNFDEILNSAPRLAAKILKNMLKVISERLRVG